MIEKQFTPKRTVCKVTFKVPAEWAKKDVKVAGDFNSWDTNSDSLKKKDGRWETTLRLEPESKYRFKYLIDGERWENDDSADDYIPNEFGTKDSLLITGK